MSVFHVPSLQQASSIVDQGVFGKLVLGCTGVPVWGVGGERKVLALGIFGGGGLANIEIGYSSKQAEREAGGLGGIFGRGKDAVVVVGGYGGQKLGTVIDGDIICS